MLISKMSQYQIDNLKRGYITVPILNDEKTRIIDFTTKEVKRGKFMRPLSIIRANPHIYQYEHWFDNKEENRAYIYRRKQHLYRFNDDILVYIALKYNLKLEVAGLNLQMLRKIEHI